MNKRVVAIAGAVLGLGLGLGLLAVGVGTVTDRAAPRLAPLTVDAATPPGVLLKTTKGFVSPAGVQVPGPVAYADATGALAYVSGAECDAACRTQWAPVPAPPTAQPFGDWTAIDPAGAGDAGGVRQWAYKGHALYVPAAPSKDAPSKDAPYKTCVPSRGAEITDWCVALFQPEADVAMPDGITAFATADANGVALAEHSGLTLYLFDGDVARDGQSCLKAPCARAWSPLAAPAMARGRGDFAAVERSDGTRQWAYKGRALYTYQGDTAPGDVKGVNIDPHFSTALLVAYATPPGLNVGTAAGFGTIWTDAAKMTLYGHHRGGDRRRGQGRLPFPPDLNCDDACRKDWTPVLAAPEATPSGYWTLTRLPDGARQWLYRGIPLYGFRGDAVPGDVKGKFRYNPFVRDGEGQIVKIAVGNPSLDTRDIVPDFWRPAFPF